MNKKTKKEMLSLISEYRFRNNFQPIVDDLRVFHQISADEANELFKAIKDFRNTDFGNLDQKATDKENKKEILDLISIYRNCQLLP